MPGYIHGTHLILIAGISRALLYSHSTHDMYKSIIRPAQNSHNYIGILSVTMFCREHCSGGRTSYRLPCTIHVAHPG